MADKDILRLVVEQTAGVLGRLREQMGKTVPYGPTKMRQTPKEARLELQRMDPYAKAERIAEVGPDEWARMMEKLYGS